LEKPPFSVIDPSLIAGASAKRTARQNTDFLDRVDCSILPLLVASAAYSCNPQHAAYPA
jgi:hypothetical protein